MTQVFNSKQFIRELSQELITNFDKASKATTPVLKGTARENEVRRKMESILPTGVGVGTGCVIDHNGNASKQQDVILFEKFFCPVFCINESPETTYYPCEGVIAVGEIKTTIGKTEIEDSFKKIKSVKSLKRFTNKEKSLLVSEKTAPFRNYLNSQTIIGTPAEQFDQENNVRDQIYGFILCGNFSVKNGTLYGHISSQAAAINHNLLPNILISLENDIIVPYNQDSNKTCTSVKDGTGFVHGYSKSGSFEYLLTRLIKVIHSGRTVRVSAFEQYLVRNPDQLPLILKSIITI